MAIIELAQIQSLSINEKLELVDDLWKSVAQELESVDVTQEEKELLESRWTNYLENPETALSEDEFTKKLNDLRA